MPPQSDNDRASYVAAFLERYTAGGLALDSGTLDRLDVAVEQAARWRAAQEDRQAEEDTHG